MLLFFSDTLFIFKIFGCARDEGVVVHIVQHNRPIFHLPSTVKAFKDLYIRILMRNTEGRSEPDGKRERMNDLTHPTLLTRITLSYKLGPAARTLDTNFATRQMFGFIANSVVESSNQEPKHHHNCM